MQPGEFGEFDWHGEEAFGTVISLRGRVVYVEVGCDRLQAQRTEVAQRLVGREEELARAFDAFKAAEAERREDAADEILGLELDLISFDSADPEVADVYFTFESSADVWSCRYRDFRFFELAEG